MESLPRKVLCDLLREHGRDMATDPRLKGLLMDYCGSCRAEIHVLLQAQQAGIPERLLQYSRRLPVSIVVAQLTAHLETDYFMAAAAARWAIETWALALGLELPAAAPPPAAISAATRATDNQHRAPFIPQPPTQNAQPTTRTPQISRLSFEPEMILIPVGEFLMGSDPKQDKAAYSNEQPQHTLYLPDYSIAKTPVTNAQYAAFVKATGYKAPQYWQNDKISQDKDMHPVVYVTGNDAMAYCKWLAKTTGKPYTLPSEAEWEKAARGTDGRLYPWGNTFDKSKCNVHASGIGDTTPVDRYPQGASPYGVLDRAGNVWEWTRSLFKSYRYDPADGRENLEVGGIRVLRGGAWYSDDPAFARCAYRTGLNPDSRYGNSGFRVARYSL